MRTLALIISFWLAIPVNAQEPRQKDPFAHTFSIVARDPQSGEMAVAVQSHWFSVGTTVSWAEAGVGAIATQSFVNKSFGPRGLEMLKKGMTAQQVLDALLADDAGKDVRQVGIVDSKGNIATHTGKLCIDYACHQQGEQFSVQANMMLGPGVCDAMHKAFKASAGKPLAERMLKALEAAQGAGGDVRGKQSAALLVVPGKSEGKPWEERTVDLRVDDATDPIKELSRLYTVHVAYQYMNEGDFQVEKGNMAAAMKAYNAAMELQPDNLEMQYWTAITLINNKDVEKGTAILKKVYAADPNWKKLTERLPKVGLLQADEALLKRLQSL